MRLEVTRKADLALQAMETLDERAARVSGEGLAESIGTSYQFLPQVMSSLVKKRWVRSTPGPNGGYRLLVSLDDVSVLDVIEAVEGTTDNGECVLTGEPCVTIGPCALHGAWTRAREALLAELGSVSIADAPGAG